MSRQIDDINLMISKSDRIYALTNDLETNFFKIIFSLIWQNFAGRNTFNHLSSTNFIKIR